MYLHPNTYPWSLSLSDFELEMIHKALGVLLDQDTEESPLSDREVTVVERLFGTIEDIRREKKAPKIFRNHGDRDDRHKEES